MKDLTVTVQNIEGIGSPLAVRFVQKANEFPCHITISHKARTINAKSLLGVLSLEIRHQDEVTLTAEGDQEAQAVSELAIILK